MGYHLGVYRNYVQAYIKIGIGIENRNKLWENKIEVDVWDDFAFMDLFGEPSLGFKDEFRIENSLNRDFMIVSTRRNRIYYTVYLTDQY